MKHFGWLRKAAASVLALAMFAAAPAALAYSDANLEAPRAKNVVIDGDLSEWDTSRCLRIDSEKQIVDQIGKAVSGHLSSSPDGSQRIGLEYDLVGDTGHLSLNFQKEKDRMELSSVTYYTRKSYRGEVTKTSKDYKALQASSEEGLELTEAVKELGTPDFMHNNYAIGGVKRITIVYTTTDKMNVFMSFDETEGKFRLKSIRSVEDKS